MNTIIQSAKCTQIAALLWVNYVPENGNNPQTLPILEKVLLQWSADAVQYRIVARTSQVKTALSRRRQNGCVPMTKLRAPALWKNHLWVKRLFLQLCGWCASGWRASQALGSTGAVKWGHGSSPPGCNLS